MQKFNRSKRQMFNPLRIQAIRNKQQQNPSPTTPIQPIYSDQLQSNHNSTSTQQIKREKHLEYISNSNQRKSGMKTENKLP